MSCDDFYSTSLPIRKATKLVGFPTAVVARVI